MRFRSRHDRQDERESGAAPGGPDVPGSGNGLERLRETGEDYLEAGAEAIRRALSEDSEAFLEAVGQEGGQ